MLENLECGLHGSLCCIPLQPFVSFRAENGHEPVHDPAGENRVLLGRPKRACEERTRYQDDGKEEGVHDDTPEERLPNYRRAFPPETSICPKDVVFADFAVFQAEWVLWGSALELGLVQVPWSDFKPTDIWRETRAFHQPLDEPIGGS